MQHLLNMASKKKTSKSDPSVKGNILRGMYIRSLGKKADVEVSEILAYKTARGGNTYRAVGTYAKKDGSDGGFNTFISKSIYDSLKKSKNITVRDTKYTSENKSKRKRTPKVSCIVRAQRTYDKCAKSYSKPKGKLRLEQQEEEETEEEEEETPKPKRKTTRGRKATTKKAPKKQQKQEEEEETEEEEGDIVDLDAPQGGVTSEEEEEFTEL